MNPYDQWVDLLMSAVDERRELQPFAEANGVSIDDAYAIQDAVIARRVAAGDRVIGAKLGLTSKAKQVAMNVDEPGYGQLLASTQLANEEPLRVAQLIHPRVEPEIVFVMGHSLAGPGVTARDVIEATAAVGCGLEVIDSRFAAFKFTLADVVADNTSAARFVVGPTWVDPHDVPDLALVGCVLEANGQGVATAAGAAVLGHPAESVALLANWLGRQGRSIEAGWLVLSGGLTNAVPIVPGGHVSATFGRLGRVGIRAT